MFERNERRKTTGGVTDQDRSLLCVDAVPPMNTKGKPKGNQMTIPKELIEAVRSGSDQQIIDAVYKADREDDTHAGREHCDAVDDRMALFAQAIVAAREGRPTEPDCNPECTDNCRECVGEQPEETTAEVNQRVAETLKTWEPNTGQQGTRDELYFAIGNSGPQKILLLIRSMNENNDSKSLVALANAVVAYRNCDNCPERKGLSFGMGIEGGDAPQPNDHTGENEDTAKAGQHPSATTKVVTGGPTERLAAEIEAGDALHREHARKLSESRAASIERVMESINSPYHYHREMVTNAENTEKKVFANHTHLGTFTAEPLDAEWKWEPATPEYQENEMTDPADCTFDTVAELMDVANGIDERIDALTKRLDAADEERAALAALTRRIENPHWLTEDEKLIIGGMRKPKEPAP